MKIFKYFIVGSFSGIIDLSLFTLFAIFLEFNYMIVGMCSFIVATAINYILSVNHVFESGVRFSKKKEIFAVFFVSGIGLIINQAILYCAVEILLISKFFSKILASGSVFFWNYSIRSFYIFQSKQHKSADY
jgi:putative flippase GtrA